MSEEKVLHEGVSKNFLSAPFVLVEFRVLWIIHSCQYCWAYLFVVAGRMVLGELVSNILCARPPVVSELALGVVAS